MDDRLGWRDGGGNVRCVDSPRAACGGKERVLESERNQTRAELSAELDMEERGSPDG